MIPIIGDKTNDGRGFPVSSAFMAERRKNACEGTVPIRGSDR